MSAAGTMFVGGEAGIRTLDTAFGPYNGLANRRLQPLGHLTATRTPSIRQASADRDIFINIFMATTVHIPDQLLKSVDRRAKALGISRNRLVVRALEATLVTADLDHMVRVPGLRVEDWSHG